MRGVGSDVVALQGSEQLAEQQRIAVCRPVTGRNEDASPGLAEPLMDEVGHPLPVEGLRPHLHGREVVDQLGQQPLLVIPLPGAQGRREHHGQALQPSKQVREEP